MSLITVQNFDVNSVTTYILDMCPTERSFTDMNGRLVKLLGMENQWLNCTAVGVEKYVS